MGAIAETLEPLRQPEYTGENRCPPCTVVNVAIAALLGIAVATVSVPVGAVVFGLCLPVIYLRGYLVPGTPRLTKRYLPERVHRLFGTHHVESEVEVGTDGDPREDVEGLLRSSGVVSDCPDADDLCLSEGFRTEWREAIGAVREDGVSLDRFAERVGIEGDEVATAQGLGGRFAITYEDEPIATWSSEAAFLADLAAAPILDDRSAEWRAFTPDEQGVVLTGPGRSPSAVRAVTGRSPATRRPTRAAVPPAPGSRSSVPTADRSSTTAGCERWEGRTTRRSIRTHPRRVTPLTPSTSCSTSSGTRRAGRCSTTSGRPPDTAARPGS